MQKVASHRDREGIWEKVQHEGTKQLERKDSSASHFLRLIALIVSGQYQVAIKAATAN